MLQQTLSTIPTVEIAYSVHEADCEGTCHVHASIRLNTQAVSLHKPKWGTSSLAWELNMHNGTKIEMGDDWAHSQSEDEVKSAFQQSIRGLTKAWLEKDFPSVDPTEVHCNEYTAAEFDECPNTRDHTGSMKSVAHTTEWDVRVPLYVSSSDKDHSLSPIGRYQDEDQIALLRTSKIGTDDDSYDPVTGADPFQEWRNSIADATSLQLDSWKGRHPHWKAHAKRSMKIAGGTTAILGGCSAFAVVGAFTLCTVM
jgi:hypothetical protein